jgi:U4/U6.U5 tri-snRNP component SNU23
VSTLKPNHSAHETNKNGDETSNHRKFLQSELMKRNAYDITESDTSFKRRQEPSGLRKKQYTDSNDDDLLKEDGIGASKGKIVKADEIDFDALVNKKTLHHQASSVLSVTFDKKKREPGFHCNICSTVYKDNLAYLDHLKSKAHRQREQQLTNDYHKQQKQEDIVEVIETHEKLTEQKSKQNQSLAEEQEYDFQEAVKQRMAQEEMEREEKCKRRKEQKAKLKETAPPPDEVAAISQEEAEMAQLMGFSGFGTSKQK